MVDRNSLTHRWVPVGALKAYKNHARLHNRQQRRKIRRLIEQIGSQPVPILVTPEFVIVDGHGLWEVLREIGAAEVFVAILQNQSAAEIKALRLAINRIPHDSRWNKPRLQKEIGELIDLSFDPVFTGFETAEIDELMRLDLPEVNVLEESSAIPPLQEKAVARMGDIFQLGPHRIGCGNALDQSFVDRIRDGCRADVCFTDPPYNLKIAGFVSGKGHTKHREFAEGVGEFSSQEFFTFLKNALAVLKVSSSPSALMYVCIDWRHILELTAAGRTLGLPLINVCVWVKNNAGMGALYRNQHELICVLKAGDEVHTNNVELGRFGRNRTNVWEYPGMSSFGSERDELLGAHPTVKPTRMIADALRDVTKRGEGVLDIFLGSGSTLIAAEETGRRCMGVDIDPLYVDLAIRRWQKVTGCDAVHVQTGRCFDDLGASSELPDLKRLFHGA
jgi:DNA modification methylase